MAKEHEEMTSRTVPYSRVGIVPYLAVSDAGKAVTFYANAFGAVEVLRLTDPTGRATHAEFTVGDSLLMVGNEDVSNNFLAPTSAGAFSSCVMVFVEDVVAAHEQALSAGATSLQEPTEQVYGQRDSRVIDPFGHRWLLSQHTTDVTVGQVQDELKYPSRVGP